MNSRLHVVSEFNRNVYDIIIASDENEVVGDEESPEQENDEQTQDAEDTGKSKKAGSAPPKKKRKPAKDKEYGVSRGIDFRNVSCVGPLFAPVPPTNFTWR